MDSLTDICFLCLRNNIKVQSVLFQDTDGIVVNEKLRCFFPEIIDSTPDVYKLSCSLCLEKLRISYDFKQSVICNSTIFKDYIEKLQCEHKSHQQLARSKHRTNLPFTRDDTAKIDEKCGEIYDIINLKFQNENLNLTSTCHEQLNTHDQSNQLTTNKNDALFTKFSCQSKEINVKTENIEVEEIIIKEEPHLDDDLSRNYLDEDLKESEDHIYECQPERIVTKKIEDDTVSNPDNNSNSPSSHSSYNEEQINKKVKKRCYKCKECPREFNAPSELEIHTRIHTGERPYKCEICQKTFTHSNSLRRHKVTHTGEKPHSCDICQKSFNRKSTLITHKRCHENVRPYQCHVCKKTFTQTSHLTTHMYIHSGQKPYNCHICEYKCAQSGDLKCHMRIHTGERPYTCKHCQKSYARQNYLKIHLKKYHNEEDA